MRDLLDIVIAKVQNRSSFTLTEAKEIGKELGIDWDEVDVDEFHRGLQVELEHGLTDPDTDITHDSPVETGKIAWAHLKELPDYYTRLDKMEKEGKENA